MDVFVPIPSSYDRNLKVQIIVSRVFNAVLPGRTLFELKQLSFNLVHLVSRFQDSRRRQQLILSIMTND